jgi:hypothetical protein
MQKSDRLSPGCTALLSGYAIENSSSSMENKQCSTKKTLKYTSSKNFLMFDTRSSVRGWISGYSSAPNEKYNLFTF